jgi:hypothetical protein
MLFLNFEHMSPDELRAYHDHLTELNRYHSMPWHEREAYRAHRERVATWQAFSRERDGWDWV